MQFKVPQFLDIEDKIFGPFTFSQFVYLAGGAGICFVIFKLLGFWLGIIPILLVAGLSLALTFYRPNGKPLVSMLEAGLNYFTQNRLYIWKRKEYKRNETKETPTNETQVHNTVKLTSSKLQDLAWSLDVLDSKSKIEN